MTKPLPDQYGYCVQDILHLLNDLLERIAIEFSNVVNNKNILFLRNFKDTDVVLYDDIIV